MEYVIDDFSTRGFGLAPYGPGRSVIEVAHAIPGDSVRVEVMRKKMRVKKGRLLELLTPSKDRIEPRCRHATLCGGCTWAAMNYDAQIKHKEARILSSFQDFLQPATRVHPMIPCEDPWSYRNKMEFSFSENRAGTRFLGLMIAHAEPYVFNVEQCEIAPLWMSECLSRVRDWWVQSGLKAYFPPDDSGTLRYLTLREGINTGEKLAILNISGTEAVDGFAEVMGEGIGSFVRTHFTKKGTPTAFIEKHLAGPTHIIEKLHLEQGTLSFKISPSSFFQTNTRQAQKLYDTALNMLGRGHSTVYDLYCGTGTLGIAAAAQSQKVIGIEMNPDAVLDARENARRNGIENIHFETGDVGEKLKLLPPPDALFVDPPRAGLDEKALSHLKSLLPKKIIYVSCNPLTQAENIRELLAVGYELTEMQAVDQFPHTAHIENIALLTR
jgi:23S rRNA (uracil1939-C5)-methyltransferase